MDLLFYTIGRMAGVLATPVCLAYIGLSYLFALIALPLSYRLLHRTRVVWVGAARVMGILGIGWVAWLLGHDVTGTGRGLVPFTGGGLWGLTVCGVAVSIWGWWRWGRKMLARMRGRRRAILTGEILFVVAFSFCAVLRMHSHGIRDQEKFMDFAFLNACIYSTHTPPADPWRFDLPINYYYGGYLQMSVPAKMTGIAPEYAYNLAVALLFGWAAVLVFGLAWELTRRIPWALGAVLLLLLMGNADVIAQRWEFWSEADPVRSFSVDWWRSSRVIKDGAVGAPQHDTINEFPFFSFLHADLHPHMVAVPYVLLFVCLLLNMLRGTASQGAFGGGGWRWARAAGTGVVLGALAMINGFDLITFGFVLGLVLLARAWIEARDRRLNGMAIGVAVLGVTAVGLWRVLGFLRGAWKGSGVPNGDWLVLVAVVATLGALGFAVGIAAVWWRKGRPRFALLRVGLWLGLIVCIAVVSHAPFFVSYDAPLKGGGELAPRENDGAVAYVVRYMQERSTIGLSDFRSGIVEFLRYWGVFALAALLWAALGFQRLGRRMPEGFGWAPWAVLGTVWAILLIWAGTVATASMLVVLLCVGVGGVGWARRGSERFVSIAVAASALIVLGCEFFYVRDAYGRGLQRMNTLFKFYYPCWILLSVVTPYVVLRFLRSRMAPVWLRVGVGVVVVWIVGMCLEYPVDTSAARFRTWRGRGQVTLDGMDWMRREHPGDYRAIQWLRKNVSPNQVVAEAVGGGYSYHARVSTHTPLRAVLGWPGHEGLWRGQHPGEEERDMKAVFGRAGFRAVEPLLKKYGVDYVYVGELEKKGVGTQAWRKFEGKLERVYFDVKYDVRIYRVSRS